MLRQAGCSRQDAAASCVRRWMTAGHSRHSRAASPDGCGSSVTSTSSTSKMRSRIWREYRDDRDGQEYCA